MTTTITANAGPGANDANVSFLELELTQRCDLECVHCYPEAGPLKGHGAMSTAAWRDVIDQAAGLRMRTVQLIGGEPTRHPAFAELLAYARGVGLKAEVFSNLTHVKASHWALFEQDGVGLSTSYYSDDPAEHDRVTTRPGSHARTRANIAEALRRGIDVHVSLVEVFPGQRVEAARAELADLGIRTDRADKMRRFGRGGGSCDVDELCGMCGIGRAAILPNGVIVPCVMGRWLIAGNVARDRLADVFSGPRWAEILARVPRRPDTAVCDPQCKPSQDGGDCAPAEQTDEE